MRRWAEFVLTHRKRIVWTWVVVAVLGGVVSGIVAKRMSYDYSIPGQPSTTAAEQIVQEFGSGGTAAPYLASLTLPGDEVVTAHDRQVARAFAAIPARVAHTRVIDQATTNDTRFTTADDRTAYAIVFYRFDPRSAALPTLAIHKALSDARPNGSVVGLTGPDMLAKGSSSKSPGIVAMTLIGGAGAIAVLAVAFGSTLALLPLVIAAASILGSFLLLYPLTEIGTFSVLVEFLIALVGLGVAIDYSLLLVTRWREERARGRDNETAVSVAMETAGRAVAFSGVTVAIGLIALVVLPVPFMRSAGIGGALIPLVSVAATLTLTPAILGGIGPRIDWPRRSRGSQIGQRWAAWTAAVVKGRWIAAGAALTVLAALIAVFAGVRVGESSTSSLASAGPAHDSLLRLSSGGMPSGALTPIEVLTKTSSARAVAASLEHVDGVARVDVPRDTANANNRLTDVIVIPHQDTTNSSTLGTVRRVRDAASGRAFVTGVSGVGAAQLDFSGAVYGHFPLLLASIAALTYLLLVRAFRSLVLPLKAVVLNLVSLGATYGVLVLFWQRGLGSQAVFGIPKTGAITFWVPVIVFAFLYGLSMDYEVFILARIREEYDATGSTDSAIVGGMARTGRLVTCAALILFLAFAAMASGPGTDLKVMATGLGFGILLDATLIRSVLVPALISLFGRWNWYLPDAVARLLRIPPPATQT